MKKISITLVALVLVGWYSVAAFDRVEKSDGQKYREEIFLLKEQISSLEDILSSSESEIEGWIELLSQFEGQDENFDGLLAQMSHWQVCTPTEGEDE